jgi:site-specific recombinase XerD
MLDAGTRATETCRLQRADLDLKSGRARVVGKGNKERFVYVGTRALHSVWLYLNTERPACKRIGVNPVFVTVSGYPLDRTSLRHILDRLGRRADVPRLHPHLLRHTCAVERLRNGMNLEFLREFLGHESLETTRQYLTGLQDEDIEAGAARTSVGDNWRL